MWSMPMGDSSVSIKSSRPRWLLGGLAIAAVAILSGSIVPNKYFHADPAPARPAAPEKALADPVACLGQRQTKRWHCLSPRRYEVDSRGPQPQAAPDSQR